MLQLHRKSPHYDIGSSPVHITYRLAGSIPKGYLKKLRAKKEKQLALIDLACGQQEMSSSERRIIQAKRREVFTELMVEEDKYLHGKSTGPYYLEVPEIAKEVIESWIYLHQEGVIFLYAICIMSNHVHIVVGNPNPTGMVSIGKLMKRTKSYTSGLANKILGRTGNAFWEDYYFDTTIRRGRFIRCMWYVLNNPVKAGLCSSWQDWPHTWVHPDYVGLFIG